MKTIKAEDILNGTIVDVRDLENLTREELDALSDELVAELKVRMEAYDERAAMQYAHVDTSPQAIDRRAAEALERPERFNGEHDVARAWLKNSKTARVWSRNGNK